MRRRWALIWLHRQCLRGGCRALRDGDDVARACEFRVFGGVGARMAVRAGTAGRVRDAPRAAKNPRIVRPSGSCRIQAEGPGREAVMVTDERGGPVDGEFASRRGSASGYRAGDSRSASRGPRSAGRTPSGIAGAGEDAHLHRVVLEIGDSDVEHPAIPALRRLDDRLRLVADGADRGAIIDESGGCR